METLKLLILFVIINYIATEVVVRNATLCGQNSQEVGCNWHYMAYFPRIFRTGFTENIMLSTHGYPKPVKVTVNLLDTNRNTVFSSNNFTVQPEKLSTLPIFMNHNSPGGIKVEVSGIGESVDGKEWSFKNTSERIQIEKLGLNIFIQTDRPIYKPGQKIQFRVIVVTHTLKPYEGKLEKVVIENPSGSRMRQWKDVDLEEGFASLELKTSEKPVMGTWKIKVELKTYKKELKVDVKKYVLPKFQVTVNPPSFASELQKTLEFEVCAKYSYGKNVYGKMTTIVCKRRRYYYYYRTRQDDSECVTVAKIIDGCVTVLIDTKEFPPPSMSYYNYQYVFDAKVKEKATEVTLNSTQITKQVHTKEVELSFQATKVFKPGFPFTVKLFAKYPDGKPIEKDLKVKVLAGTSGYYSGNLYAENITISNGMTIIKLPPIPFNAQEVSVRATYEREKIYPTERKYRRQSYGSIYIKPWYSPTHSYLHIEKQKQAMQNGTTANVTVKYTSVDGKEVERNIYYSLMCAGNVALSGSVKRTFKAAIAENPTDPPTTTTTTTTTTLKPILDKNGTRIFQITPRPIYWWERPPVTRPPLPYQFSVGSFKFSFNVTKNMFPSCRMIVYYIRGEEVVADDTEIDVVDEFENKVSIKFDKSEVKPGNKVKLTVKGFPKSRIAIAAVDKSIHFLAKGNDIKPKDLFNIRNTLDITPGWVNNYGRCPRRWGRRKRSIAPGWFWQDYVDSEKAFSNVGVTFLSSLNIDVRPCKELPLIEYSRAVDDLSPDGGTEGIPGPVGATRKNKKLNSSNNQKKNARPRTEFPETWLWTEEKLSKDGVHVFDVKVPDTITSWYASGFAVSKQAGLGVASPTELRAFQPFFISLVLPYSVVRGEDVTVPAAVFSYLENACITVRVSLSYSPENYRIIAGPSAKTCICGGRTATVLFRVQPRKLGRIPIRVSAETLDENACAVNKPFNSKITAADSLIKKLLVEPEGVKEDHTQSSFFCPKDTSGTYNADFTLQVPSNVVPGSVFAKVTAMGDLMGSSLSNIDELLAMPYGCGEQNMLKFAPNIFIMNYLNNTNQVSGEIKTKALDYMRSGYQRELTYKHGEKFDSNFGSYSAFGHRDKNGSTWLTAFVLKSYAQARPWIDVDPTEIDDPKNWLLNIQSKDGCFPTVGSLHNKAMKGGVKTPATLTAYVLISLLEADLGANDQRAVKAASCVSNTLDEIKDSYSLSIIAYMFAKMKDTASYNKVMKRLDAMAIKEDGMIRWEEPKEKEDSKKQTFWYYAARSTDIEQTAYALIAKLTLTGKKTTSDNIPIVKWLSKQRNGLGGWSSTQDTVLAMQALAEFAEITYGTAADMSVLIRAGPDFEHTFKVNKENALVLQRVEDVPVPNTVKLTATGEGCALVQVNIRYNVKEVKAKPSFEVTHSIKTIQHKLTKRQSCRSQMLKVCARWLRKGESNMALVDVQMISGFEANSKSFEKALQNTKGLKDIEIKGKGVMFYFNRLNNKFRCFEIRVDQTSNVRKAKPVPITVYDYYDTEKSATVMYEFTNKQCRG
ncbi:alpha-2-macroglobulin-like protein 1 isoform X4 [Hydractinia symbiolongicarpus]|uniref:alpha-2-macroglobulin-like protein 1 isoform X4 n=1 Tax=Hydractinia symbiolongicarpus TaxID=13093 RepID=UPI00254DFD8C|nr:alpha-2-macroglobulin-like protein 1 isoform X4 [Hydractinia symbiolongicarpus]